MQVQYDTDTVPGPDRYEYYRAAAAGEVAPVEVCGRAARRLHARLAGLRAGEFLVESAAYAADCEVGILRDSRMIRAGDPDCYRMMLNITGGECTEQAGIRACLGPRDIGLFSLSVPFRNVKRATVADMRVVMVTFPRRLLPVGEAAVTPLLGSLLPRSLPGRSLLAQFLADLAGTRDPGPGTAGLAEVLRQAVTGLIRERLGMPGGFTPGTRRLLYQEWARVVIVRRSGDPDLSPAGIARALGISERYLHQIFRDADQSLMQLVKADRLEHCYRDLRDPALAATPVAEIAAARGYRRADQFARDFRHKFGISPTQVRGPQPRDSRRPA